MLFLVLIGGGVGAAARYALSGAVHSFVPGVFPWGTLAINLTGSLVIGLLFGLFEDIVVAPQLRTFLFIGILGGFTTFSTFGLETVNLLRDNELGLALGNILLSNILGIALVFLGLFAARFALNIVLR